MINTSIKLQIATISIAGLLIHCSSEMTLAFDIIVRDVEYLLGACYPGDTKQMCIHRQGMINTMSKV